MESECRQRTTSMYFWQLSSPDVSCLYLHIRIAMGRQRDHIVMPIELPALACS